MINEKGEEVGCVGSVGPDGVEGVPGSDEWTPAAGTEKGKLEDPFDNENFFDNLEVDEDRILEMQKGGGEVVEPSNVCESGACMI